MSLLARLLDALADRRHGPDTRALDPRLQVTRTRRGVVVWDHRFADVAEHRRQHPSYARLSPTERAMLDPAQRAELARRTYQATTRTNGRAA